MIYARFLCVRRVFTRALRVPAAFVTAGQGGPKQDAEEGLQLSGLMEDGWKGTEQEATKAIQEEAEGLLLQALVVLETTERTCAAKYSAFAVNPSLDPLSLGHFSPILPRFSPLFRRLLRLAPKTPETGTKTPKNGPKRSRNGREKGAQDRLIANAR